MTSMPLTLSSGAVTWFPCAVRGAFGRRGRSLRFVRCRELLLGRDDRSRRRCLAAGCLVGVGQFARAATHGQLLVRDVLVRGDFDHRLDYSVFRFLETRT